MTPAEVAHVLVQKVLIGLPRERHVKVSPAIIVLLRTKGSPTPLLGNPPHFTAKLRVTVRQKGLPDVRQETRYIEMDEARVVLFLTEWMPWAERIVAARTLEQIG